MPELAPLEGAAGSDVAELGFAQADWAPPAAGSFLWSRRGSVSVFATERAALPYGRAIAARANSNAVCVRASGLALELPNASDPWAADHQGCQLFADPDGGAGLDEGLPSLCLPRSRSYREPLSISILQ